MAELIALFVLCTYTKPILFYHPKLFRQFEFPEDNQLRHPDPRALERHGHGGARLLSLHLKMSRFTHSGKSIY